MGEHSWVAYLVGVLVGDQEELFQWSVLVEAREEDLGGSNLEEGAVVQVMDQEEGCHLALTFLHGEEGCLVVEGCLEVFLLPLLELFVVFHEQTIELVTASSHYQRSIVSFVLNEMDHLSHIV